MKNYFLIFILLFTINSVNAQLRHTKGINSIGISGGVTDLGYTAGLKYSKFINRNFKVEINPLFEFSNYKKTKNYAGYLNTTLVYSAINVNDVYFLGPKVGLGFSYSILDANGSLQNNESLVKENFTFGPLLGIENEVFISDHFSISLDGIYNYNPVAKFGKHRIISQLSFNINFY